MSNAVKGSGFSLRTTSPRDFGRALMFCGLLAFTLSGCAAGRDVVDVAPSPTVSNAVATGAPVKIVAVTDDRVFEAAPRDPSTPSLEHATDITNPAITVRAFARKRGGYGNALGDIILPEGHSVADLVRAATQKALQQRGYRVVDATSPDFAQATPVSVDIKQFWAWFTPGAIKVTVECRAVVIGSGGVFVGASPDTFTAHASTGGLIATDSDFTDVMRQTLDALTAQMAAQMKSP